MRFYAALIFSIAILLPACKPDEETFRASYRPLTEAVYASGYIMPQEEYQVFSLAEGYILRKLVEEGDTVSEGTPLFIINSNQQQAKLSSAQEAYIIARQNMGKNSPVLQELESSLKNAALTLSNDSVNYIRFKHLWEQQATSKQKYDNALLAYESSKNQYDILQKRFEQTKQSLQLKLQETQSQLQIAQEEQGQFTIKSLIKGKVYEVYKEEGETVRRNEQMALLGDPNRMYLKLSVDEQDIRKVRLGQELLAKIDLEGDQVYRGVVTRIYPMLNRQDQSFQVDAEFVGEYPNRFSGGNAEANIIIKEQEKTLTISKKLLATPDSVWILQDGEKQKIRIEKGLENLEYVEVLSGLDTGSLILMP